MKMLSAAITACMLLGLAGCDAKRARAKRQAGGLKRFSTLYCALAVWMR